MELFDEYGRRKKIKVKVKEGKLKKRENRMGYVFMIPYVAGALICLLYPLIIAIIYAFSNVVVKTNTVTFNGIQNFASVLDKNPELITQLGTLAFKMLLGVPLIVVFALLMAMMLNMKLPGSPVAFFSSFTSCQPLNASRKLIYPGFPFNTFTGRSLPSSIKILEGFWFGLHPYFN